VGKDRSKIRDLFADERRNRAILDCLCSPSWKDIPSEISEQETREREDMAEESRPEWDGGRREGVLVR